ncbi:SMI1/KNR4 family protein [Sporosarcina sp. ANT_H38]|uniref:YrhA family protein n=1 Tax=Sporosarcina sp. ANT_H38 TaxID=2597358 RepID=UPI0011F2CFC4|nr:YrhA family protein [Sporosarcina sp. ANT_H38]KAA0944295.1 SMI1/KNR4 family protein [Sporosarcina sp. ANT_H38]
MWNIKLEEIIEEKNLYGEQVNTGASEVELAKFMKNVKEELQKDLPSEYNNVLKAINGLEFNGFILYGIDEVLLEKKPNQHINGLISFNQIWYENEDQKKYLFLGESNISWYVYDTNKEQYIELDNPSGREMVEFKKFDEMLEKILSDSLL